MKKDFHLLLVEDDDDHADLTLRMLRKLGDSSLRVERYSTLAEASEALHRTRKIDLVLLDLSLPDSGVAETLPAIIKGFPLVPVVVLTSLNDMEVGRAAIKQGAQDFLSKSGMTPEGLQKAIDYAMERKAAMAKLERSNEALRHFAHLVAHEVKKPLQALTTTIYHIDERDSDHLQTASKKLIGLSKESIQDMTSIVDELLRYAEAGGSTSNVEFAPVDMHAVVEEAIATIRLQREYSEVELTCDPLPTVLGSNVQLRHVFLNLIGNAAKYQDPARKCTVHVGASTKCVEEGKHLFFVKDNGRGIPAQFQRRIFDLFFRLQSGENDGGSGIGLGFTKQVVEQHGGEIWVESKPHEGSTFFFTLPLEPGKN